MRGCKGCGMNYDEQEFGICPYCGEEPEEVVDSTEDISREAKPKAEEAVSSEKSKPLGNKTKFVFIGVAVLAIIGVAISAIFALGGSGVTVPDQYPTIQEAIDAAEDGDEIVVDLGVYRERIDFKGKNITVRSTDPDDPDVVDQTIIDGGGGTVVSFRSGEGEGAVLSGLTVSRGSGIVISGESSPVISKNVIEDNTAEYGGGIAVFDSSPTIVDNLIIGNSGFLGGGIFIEASSPLVKGNEISRNRAEMGSGMVIISNSAPEVLDNKISDNVAERLGGGLVVAVDSSPTIKGNSITDNVADRNGGGLVIEESEPIVEENIISRNSAANGGGIFIVNSMTTALLIAGNDIADNSASIAGGGLYMEGSSPIVENNTFSDNISEYLGGGAVVYNSEPKILRNSFENNRAEDPDGDGGGAIWVSGDSTLDLDDPDENIYTGNVPDDIFEE